MLLNCDDQMTVCTRMLVLTWALCSPAMSISAQEAESTLEGSGEGPLVIGREKMNLAFTFASEAGGYSSTLTSSGLGLYGLPVTSTEVDGRRMVLRVTRLDLVFTGTLRRDDQERIRRIDGEWFQHGEMVPVALLPVKAPAF